jgi:hypothetical protein
MRTLIGVCVAAVTLLGVAAAPACGGSDTLTLEEYFEELEELENEADERSTEIEEEADEIFGSAEDFDEIRGDFQDFIDDIRGVFEDFLDGVRDLNPPEEVEEDHDEAVEAFEAVLDEFDGLKESVDDADSFEDIDSEAFDEADAQLTEACEKLQAAADDNDIDVDLNCGDE